MTAHKYQPGQIVTAKASGNLPAIASVVGFKEKQVAIQRVEETK